MGVLSLFFGLFQARIGDLSERRSQRTLRAALMQVMDSGAGLGRDGQGRQHPLAVGSGVALLDIARIDVHKVVVEGADGESLKKGPGLVMGTPLPGQTGQTIIVGRRTTFGSPFRHLDVLAPGDEIQTVTPFGRFRYRVRETRRVAAGTPATFSPADGSLLTLVTSDPAYIGGQALTVVATLQGRPSTFADPPRKNGGDPNGIAFRGNAGSAAGVMFLGVLLLVAIVGTDLMYRRWRRWPTYVLTTPVILALLFAWMENLTSLFPSSL